MSNADIAVPEHERELRFYSRVLTSGDAPLWRDDLMNNLGMPIIGLGERNEEYADLPLQWMPHIQVADVAASVQRTLDLGGSVIMQDENNDGTSQWAVLLDPDEAAFGLIPAVPAEDNSGGAMGSIVWLDLTVSDASAIRDFYQRVIGWSVDSVEIEDAGESYLEYKMLDEHGAPVAEICQAHGDNQGLPPAWIIYLSVGDFPESLSRVKAEGGKVINTKKGKDGEFERATIQDPVGVFFGLMPRPE